MAETESKTTPPIWEIWGAEIAEVWRDGWSRFWPRAWIVLAACLIGMALVLTVGDVDVTFQQKIHVDGSPMTETVARLLSKYGDLGLSGPVALLIWLAGAVRKKVRWRKLGMACLMATLLAGATTDVFRFTTGRPRPYAAAPFTDVADGFYGPHWSTKYQSFPSGHATASSATAATLGGALPVLAVPCALYTLSVSWSRIQLDKHHPIDVTVGTIVGVLCGLCFAGGVPGAAVQLRPRRKPRPTVQDCGSSDRLR